MNPPLPATRIEIEHEPSEDGISSVRMKGYLYSWELHCHKLAELTSRVRFQSWMVKTFTAKQLALFIDGEIGYDEMYNTYLREVSGKGTGL